MVADEVDVAGDLRARLLRDRDDVDRLLALRHRPLRDGEVQLLAAPGRPDDRLRPRGAQDGGAAAPGLRPDARAEVGDRDGRLRELRRDVQQLHDPPGRRQDRPRRHPRARLPAPPGGADGGHRPAAREGAWPACRPRTRSAESRPSVLRRGPGARRDEGGPGRDDARRRSGAAGRGVHAPARRAGLQPAARHHRHRLPGLGRRAGLRLHRHARTGATSTIPRRRATRGRPSRSRSASRSATTCCGSPTTPRASASRSGSTTARPSRR